MSPRERIVEYGGLRIVLVETVRGCWDAAGEYATDYAELGRAVERNMDLHDIAQAFAEDALRDGKEVV